MVLSSVQLTSVQVCVQVLRVSRCCACPGVCTGAVCVQVCVQVLYLREGDAEGNSSDDSHVALDEGRHQLVTALQTQIH